MIDRDLSHFHPEFRRRMQRVLARLEQEHVPIKLFEGFRAPERQEELFRKRPPVTHARAWQSAHAYGLGADFVLFLNGQWSWDDSGPEAKYWERLHAIGREEGLEPLSFEKPHLQLKGFNWRTLQQGHYPAGGDSDWAENLTAAIKRWKGRTPAAPPAPKVASRPALTAAALALPELAHLADEDDDEPTVPPEVNISVETEGEPELRVTRDGKADARALPGNGVVGQQTPATAIVAAPPAEPVPGGGPGDPAVKANKGSLVTKMLGWWGGGTSGSALADSILSRVQGLTGFSPETQLYVVRAIFWLCVAAGFIAVADHFITKWFKARPDRINVK